MSTNDTQVASFRPLLLQHQQHQQQPQRQQRRQQQGQALETLSVLHIGAFLFGIAKTLQMIIRI